MQHQIDSRNLYPSCARIIKGDSPTARAVLKYRNENGEWDYILVFLVASWTDHASLFSAFTGTVIEWIDTGYLDVPEGYDDWTCTFSLSPS